MTYHQASFQKLPSSGSQNSLAQGLGLGLGQGQGQGQGNQIDNATGLYGGIRADLDIRTLALLIGELGEELRILESADLRCKYMYSVCTLLRLLAAGASTADDAVRLHELMSLTEDSWLTASLQNGEKLSLFLTQARFGLLQLAGRGVVSHRDVFDGIVMSLSSSSTGPSPGPVASASTSGNQQGQQSSKGMKMVLTVSDVAYVLSRCMGITDTTVTMTGKPSSQKTTHSFSHTPLTHSHTPSHIPIHILFHIPLHIPFHPTSHIPFHTPSHIPLHTSPVTNIRGRHTWHTFFFHVLTQPTLLTFDTHD